ncbi:hypothetical protein DND47_16670 [Pseudomonas syringae pv. syringae]|nr:hypothetical protein DND47_16670 [Pseudomonas syringae pv. syringae]
MVFAEEVLIERISIRPAPGATWPPATHRNMDTIGGFCIHQIQSHSTGRFPIFTEDVRHDSEAAL